MDTAHVKRLDNILLSFTVFANEATKVKNVGHYDRPVI